MKTLLVEFFNTTAPLSADVEGIVLLGMKTFIAQKSDAHFQMLVFFKINNLLFTNLVACTISFKYWF